jgi:ABC-2 type transport system permease protein
MTRTIALLGKEWLDLRRNRGALVPVAVITTLSLVLPFAIAVGIPLATGELLSEDPSLQRISAIAAPGGDLTGDARIQSFLFQQFLVLFLLTPITGAMSLASHAIIGEKQARTLEPLLATPISTLELLVAKILGALLPTLAMSLAGLAVYFAGIGALAAPGVLGTMATARTAILVGLVGPAAALVALQVALLISSRMNDPRTAQQFGVLFIIPVAVILVAQFAGSLWLSAAMLTVIGLGLAGVWALLTVLSVAVFDRETILTRWR